MYLKTVDKTTAHKIHRISDILFHIFFHTYFDYYYLLVMLQLMYVKIIFYI
jgi:hypothetical protein